MKGERRGLRGAQLAMTPQGAQRRREERRAYGASSAAAWGGRAAGTRSALPAATPAGAKGRRQASQRMRLTRGQRAGAMVAAGAAGRGSTWLQRPLLSAPDAGCAGRCGSRAPSSSLGDALSLRGADPGPRQPLRSRSAPPSPRRTLLFPTIFPSSPHDPPPAPGSAPPPSPLPPLSLSAPALTQRPQRRAQCCKVVSKPLCALLQVPSPLVTHTAWRCGSSFKKR